ncbi:hypothetical protein BDD43_0849 [Mucilaginibacter gracilis]|uniref:DoxX-like protein n=1 Tax=Mucilaginibacter gracilis TaxID=423350 RepID=A0A495IVD0_9SPHI|nr:DUF6790 family protein [Mucilaginibacter gracilis]RKR80717.1 hypothetical protein BDD43_0849 [Mucilaginibacter gracilis]
MAKKNLSLYLISVSLFMLVLPVSCITYQCHNGALSLSWGLIGKWFLFWSVGVRLFTAGLKQTIQPEFTAREIFHFRSSESFVVIRELGFANISIGLIGILSLFNAQWATPAAIAGGLYFGLAGIMHIFKRPDSRNEILAMISDLFIFLLMICYLIFTL